MNHYVIQMIATEDTTDASPSTDNTLHAYMAGRGTEETPINSLNVLASKRASDNKGKSRTANETKSAPSTVKIQGHQYFAHMTMAYCICQHDVATHGDIIRRLL
jgi:hypothetical protein